MTTSLNKRLVPAEKQKERFTYEERVKMFSLLKPYFEFLYKKLENDSYYHSIGKSNDK